MTPRQILKNKKIAPTTQILYLDAEEVLENLIEALKEYEVDFDLSRLSKNELEILFKNYADSMVTFHPENYHQELGAFWRSREILIKRGMTEEEVNRVFEFT